MGITSSTARRIRNGAELPAVCAFGDCFVKSGANAGQYVCLSTNTWTGPFDSSASGDVQGPVSATDNAIARYDGTTGKVVQNSVVTIADTTGAIAGGRSIALSGSSSGVVTIQTAAAAGTWTLTLPTTDGDSGQALTTDGNGVASWTAIASGTTINATDGVIPYRSNSTTFVDSPMTRTSATVITSTARLLVPDGSSGSPAIAFASGGAQGIYNIGGGYIGISGGGGEALQINAGTIRMPGSPATFILGDGGSDVALSNSANDVLTIGGTVRVTPMAFASLPATPQEGMIAWVTDSSTATWGDTITGGGANKVLAVFNGTVWTVAGK